MKSSKRSYIDLSAEQEVQGWREEALQGKSGRKLHAIGKLSTSQSWLRQQAARSAKQQTHIS